MSIIRKLARAVAGASAYNPEVQAPPACILWPDRERLWEPAITLLMEALPQLLVLGEYRPERRQGPAIWLRCAIAGVLDGVGSGGDATPILYLPGVSRQDLRAVSDCPDALKPLAELQYRGVIWSQVNAKDWTPYAFLTSSQGGLGLDVARDNETREALRAALPRLLEEDMGSLRGRLDASVLNALLTGGDPVRDLLAWLNQPDAMRQMWPDEVWKAFTQVCRAKFAFHPEKSTPLEGVGLLTGREGNWKSVWQRYSEAPRRYPGVAEQIRSLPMPDFGLFPEPGALEPWPQWNERQEGELYAALCRIDELPAHEARKKLAQLDQQHGERRTWLWAELGESPLAQAVLHLKRLAEITAKPLAGGNASDMRAAYAQQGWMADDAMLRALECISDHRGQEAITKAARAIYRRWADESARHLQKVWEVGVDGRRRGEASPHAQPDECLLFVDGLRLDCGKRLAELLRGQGLDVEEHVTWAALPSVTGTGKYAVSPILDSSRIAEEPEVAPFTPITQHLFRILMREKGWQTLDRHQVQLLHREPVDAGMPTWVEFGDIDHAGHERGWRLARHIDEMLEEVQERIQALLAQGWAQLRVVTDHGWLLLPGGLPKTELPASLVESKWGRCAQIKPGAVTDYPRYPWYWNEREHFALAEGIHCFKAGEEYAHGGLSLQECVIPELVVTLGRRAGPAVQISDLVWKGLRCTLVLEGEAKGLRLDLREHAADPGTSRVVATKPFKADGKASVVVEDDTLEGESAQVVILDAEGKVVAQQATRIGGSE